MHLPSTEYTHVNVDGAFSALQLKSTCSLILMNVRHERNMVKQPCVHCHPTTGTSSYNHHG